ncbi:MAG: hypothetical protein ABFS32_22460 [Bacteroidota bacterium]
MLVSTCCGAEAWNETDLCSACKEHADFEEDNDYDYYEAMAEENGWVTPVNDFFDEDVWVTYWMQMEKSKNGEIEGRPIPPHRSA